MTLPFRRRHHDAEETHDRARALTSDELLAALDPDDADWLGRHLAACSECRREHEAFAADRELLRSLRDKPIEPPRDLWARTAAALDREAGKRQPIGTGAARRSAGAGAGDRRTRTPWRGLSANAAAGALVSAPSTVTATSGTRLESALRTVMLSVVRSARRCSVGNEASRTSSV